MQGKNDLLPAGKMASTFAGFSRDELEDSHVRDALLTGRGAKTA
ncbi:hypothetical protein [Nonomuraea roseola]|uniref:Uncharacterized protein n=1 Tax=Nonomuraea roseola TaxID=46179 RepID=A0ABV5PXS3_9ACTN